MDYKEKRKRIMAMKGEMQDIEMQEAISQFLKSRKLKNLTDNTTKFYLQTLNKFADFMEQNEIAKPRDVIMEDVQEFIQQRAGKGISAPTINKYIRSMRAFFRHMRNSGFINDDPMEFIDNQVEEKRVIRTLSREQTQALFNTPNRATPAGFRNFVFMLTLLDTGMRLEEAITFYITDIYWKERVIKVYGKGRKERFVPFSDTLAPYLMQYSELRGETEHLTFFVNVDGQPLKRRTIQEEISNYGKAANIKGVRVSCHSLRYTFARNYLLLGGDVMTLMNIMGHKSLTMVQLYAEMFQTDINRQHGKFSPVSSILND